MQELVRYLLDNLYLDFQGDVTADRVREFLGQDDSPAARNLLERLLDDGGVDELLLTLADVLKENLATGITERTVSDQLQQYTDA